jgi:hypothetical protein
MSFERRRRMTTAEHSTVMGVFADRAHVEQALNELRQAGFSDDQVGFSAGNEPEGGQKEQADSNTEQDSSAWTGPIVVVVNAENRQEEASDILRRNGANNVSSHAQPAREASASVPAREYDPILGPTLVDEENILPADFSGFGLTRDPALDTKPEEGSKDIHPDQGTQEQAPQLDSADVNSWKNPNVKNPRIQ